MTCAADLYRPDGPAGSLPCLVMGHGFSGTKCWHESTPSASPRPAWRSWVFDYRHFGASGGQPGQLVDVVRQREDYHAAVRWTRSCPGIDPERIALWGTSFSGGHVIAVAVIPASPRWRQVPLLDARRTGRTTRQRLRRALSRSVLKLFVAPRETPCVRSVACRPTCARVVGRPGEAAVYTDPQVAAIFAELGGEAAGWRNAFASRFLFGLPRYRPGTRGAAANAALGVRRRSRSRGITFLRCMGCYAGSPWSGSALSVGHFDVYVDPVRTLMITDQIAFLRAHVWGHQP